MMRKTISMTDIETQSSTKVIFYVDDKGFAPNE